MFRNWELEQAKIITLLTEMNESTWPPISMMLTGGYWLTFIISHINMLGQAIPLKKAALLSVYHSFEPFLCLKTISLPFLSSIRPFMGGFSFVITHSVSGTRLLNVCEEHHLPSTLTPNSLLELFG